MPRLTDRALALIVAVHITVGAALLVTQIVVHYIW